MVLTNIIRHLRYIEGALVMTQEELANRVGVSRQTINAIERSKHQPSLELTFKIADVFRMRIEEIFCYFPNDDLDIDDKSRPPVTIEISVINSDQ